MKRILSTILILSLLLSIAPNSYASAVFNENIVSNFKELKVGNTHIVSFDAKIENEEYNYKTKFDTTILTIEGNGKIDHLTINKSKDLLIVNGEQFKLSEIIDETIVYEDVALSEETSNVFSQSRSNSVTDPTTLSYNYLLTANVKYSVNDAITGISVVAGLILVFIAPPAGYAWTAKGFTALKIAGVLSVLVPVGATDLLEGQIVYFKKRQYQSATKARLDVTLPPMYVYKEKVRFYKDSDYTESISFWETAGYFQ